MVKDKQILEAPLSKQSSQSSVASNDSILSTGSLGKGFEITNSSRGIFGKKSKYNFGLKKKKNKISKHDFYNKTSEFRMWLKEEKALNLDELSDSKAKELFKKFVKKWNKKDLHQKYYAGTDPLWSVASPSSYSRVGVPSDDDTLVEPSGNTPDVSPTPSGFSTFGKKSGLRMLKKFQDKPLKEQHSPKGVPENVYDELIFGKASFQKPKSGFASPSKSIALSQLFQNQNLPSSGQRQGASPVCTPVANPKPPCSDVNPYSEPYSPPLPSPPPPEDLVIPGPTFVAPPPPPPETDSSKNSPIYAQPEIRKTPADKRPAIRSRSQENVGCKGQLVDSPTLRMPPPPPPPPRSRSMQFDSLSFSLPPDRPLTRSRSRESVCSISSVASEPAYNIGRVGRSSSRRRPPPPPPKRTDSLKSVNSDYSYRRCGPFMTPLSQSASGTITRSRSRESLASTTSDLGSSLGMSDRQSQRYGSQQSIQSAMSMTSQSAMSVSSQSAVSVTSQTSHVLPDAGSPARLPKRGAPRRANAPPPPPFAPSKEISGYASIKKKRPSIHLAKSLEDISTKVLSTSNTLASKEDIKKFKKDERFDTSLSWTKPILV